MRRRKVEYIVRVLPSPNPLYESVDAALLANVGLLAKLIRAGETIQREKEGERSANSHSGEAVKQFSARA